MSSHANASVEDAQIPASQVIQFYIPSEGQPVRLPARASEYWQWILDNPKVAEGRYSWTLQTFLWLQECGFPCRLVREFPTGGIVVSHRDFLSLKLFPRRDVFLVCIKADRNTHPWAHFQIVQNESDPARTKPGGKKHTATIPFWPQPGLLPRSAERGSRCENVAYFGRALNLAPELRADAWAGELQKQGVRWLIPERAQWHDYREVDVTVSVRQFGEQSAGVSAVLDIDSKPPSKLINSWIAGVPAVLGREPAFQHIRRSKLDFIEVDSADGLRRALETLRSDPALFTDMIENGRERAKEFSVEAVASRWVGIFADLSEQHAAWAARNGAWRQVTASLAYIPYLLKPQHVRSIFGALSR